MLLWNDVLKRNSAYVEALRKLGIILHPVSYEYLILAVNCDYDPDIETFIDMASVLIVPFFQWLLRQPQITNCAKGTNPHIALVIEKCKAAMRNRIYKGILMGSHHSSTHFLALMPTGARRDIFETILKFI